MNYKTMYKNAQKWVECIFPELSCERRMEAEAFFPELKESKDERTRKAIIEHLRQDIELEQILSEEVGSDWIAWLEKQGSQNLANSAKICKEDEKMFDMTEINLRELRDRFSEKYSRAGECIAWLKSLKERFGCEANCTTKKSEK